MYKHVSILVSFLVLSNNVAAMEPFKRLKIFLNLRPKSVPSSNFSRVLPKEDTPHYVHVPQKKRISGMQAVHGKIPVEIQDFVDSIKRRAQYERMGVSVPTGLLMIGRPGTGKTYIASRIAQEAGFGFVSANASQFAGGTIGDEQKHIKTMFEDVRKASRENKHNSAILFIDEFDAIGSRKKFGNNVHIAYRQAIAMLLMEMEVRFSNTTEYIIGATNKADDIDPAFKRPGRFDRIIELGLPDHADRMQIIEFYATKTRYDKRTIDFNLLANLTDGFTPAELKFLVNDAAVRAVREDADCVAIEHYYAALEGFLQREKIVSKNSLQDVND